MPTAHDVRQVAVELLKRLETEDPLFTVDVDLLQEAARRKARKQILGARSGARYE